MLAPSGAISKFVSGPRKVANDIFMALKGTQSAGAHAH